MKQTPLTGSAPFTKRLNRNRRNGRSFGPVRRALLLLVWAAAVPAALAADVPLVFRNPGMEEGSGSPAAWMQGPTVAGVQYLWDQRTGHGGKASLCLRKTAQRYFPIAQWSQSLEVETASTARKLRVQCWVKAEAVTKAIIDVSYEGGRQQPGHSWAVFLGQKQASDPVVTHDWKLYEGVVEVPAKASNIGVAFQIYGPGSVWFDDLQIAWVRGNKGSSNLPSRFYRALLLSSNKLHRGSPWCAEYLPLS
jgi:hypothetical protein